MKSTVVKNLEYLLEKKKLEKPIVLWGIGVQTSEVIDCLNSFHMRDRIIAIADNFKYTFYREYKEIRVIHPSKLEEMRNVSPVVLLAVNHTDAIRKQLDAYGITEVYNLRNLSDEIKTEKCELLYHFINRSRGQETLCYILAGYEPVLWDNTLERIAVFQDKNIDYCIVSSGKYDKALDETAKMNNWSYLYTEKNQVCFVSNLVIELHPKAKYIIKMDEDIFIGEKFFHRMVQEFQRIESEGEYRIGFAVPVIPLNCCGYVSYLKLTGNIKEYEVLFGRAYRSRFSAVFHITETAEFLWDSMDTFDSMVKQFLGNKETGIVNCYFNIGYIMYTRERWLLMGKWPVKSGESGMGVDESYIYRDNMEKDMPIYEIRSVLAGHLAFGHQKKRMLEYYQKHPEKFAIHK